MDWGGSNKVCPTKQEDAASFLAALARIPIGSFVHSLNGFITGAVILMQCTHRCVFIEYLAIGSNHSAANHDQGLEQSLLLKEF